MYNDSVVYPWVIYLRFQSRRCNGLASSVVPDSYTSAASPTAISNHYYERNFKDSALATFNAGGMTPTNQANLDSLASQFASDFNAWKSVSFDRVYNGVLSTLNSPHYDEIIVDYNINDISTRIHTEPFNSDPEELMHHDPAAATCTGSLEPCVRYYAWPGMCSGGHLTIPVMSLCLVDGRLKPTYLFTDVLS